MMPDSQPSLNTNSAYPFGGSSCQLHYARLSPEVNSSNIFDGPGSKALWDVIDRFEALADQISVKSASLKNWNQALQGQWSGQSATRMAETAEKFQQWMDDFSQEAWKAALNIRYIAREFVEAQHSMKSTVEVAENRAQRETLVAEQSSGLARHDEEIAALDKEYERFWAHDVEVMWRYETYARDKLASMPSWPEPPPADPELSRIHTRGG